MDMANFPEFENDLLFVEHMVTEQSVFCLPGRVNNKIDSSIKFPSF